MSDLHTLGADRGITTMLRLTSPAARVILALFMVTNGCFLFGNLGMLSTIAPSIVAFVLVMAAATALVTVPGEVFPLAPTVATIAVCVTATALVSWQLPLRDWPGYAAWHLGATSIVFFTLALRGRISLAWLGFAGVVAVTLAWSATTGRGIPFGLSFTSRQAGFLLIGTVFAIGLRRTASRVSRLGREQALREAQDAAALATLDERANRMAYVSQLAGPTLDALATADEITPEIARRARVVEGSLRDLLRASSLYREPLVTAASDARFRGVDVVLLDDSTGSHPHERLTAFAQVVCDELRALQSGHLTARLLPAGRPTLATVVADDGLTIRRRRLGSDGAETLTESSRPESD